MIRVSATTLESYRRVVQTEYGDEGELAASIRGKPLAPSWQMSAGQAWHGIVRAYGDERYDRADISEPQDHGDGPVHVRIGQHWFDLHAVKIAAGIIGPGVWEVKATRVWEIGGREVTVAAQVDHVRGLHIAENKTKFSGADARTYEPSLQWRYYLAVHGAACVRYNLWHMREPKGGYCELTDVSSFRFWPYADLESDCRRWLAEFLGWADSRDLMPFLDRAGSSLTADAAA